jgi:hypothetical protein
VKQDISDGETANKRKKPITKTGGVRNLMGKGKTTQYSLVDLLSTASQL